MSYPLQKSQREGINYKGEESRTKQSFADSTDINLIMKKFEKTGTIEGDIQSGLSFGDFFDAEDYHTSLNKVRAADMAFAELPAAIRARMDHDPGKFVEFVADPKNLDEGVILGLYDAPQEWVHPDDRKPEEPAPETDPPEGGVS